MVCIKLTISSQTFWRLSSTNFTWSILKYFVPYERLSRGYEESQKSNGPLEGSSESFEGSKGSSSEESSESSES